MEARSWSRNYCEFPIHPEGDNLLLSSSNLTCLTGGVEGEVAQHQYTLENKQFATLKKKCVHKSPIISKCSNEFGIFTGGSDGVINEISIGNRITCTPWCQLHMPIEGITATQDYVAFISGGNVGIVYKDQTMVWNSLTDKSYVNLHWMLPNTEKKFGDILLFDVCGNVSRLIVSDDFNCQMVLVMNLSLSLSKRTIVSSFNSEVFLCCPQNGLLRLQVDDESIKMIDHIRPPNESHFSMAVIKGNLLLTSDKTVCVYSLPSFEEICLFPHESKSIITGICGEDINKIFLLDNAVCVSMAEIDWKTKTSPIVQEEAQFVLKRIKSNSRMLIDDEEDDDFGKEEEKKKKNISNEKKKVNFKEIKSKKNRKMIEDEADDDDGEKEGEDSEGEEINEKSDIESDGSMGLSSDGEEEINDDLNDFSVDEEENNYNQDQVQVLSPSATAAVNLPECIHKQFQPFSTSNGDYRFLCWNFVGSIISRKDASGYCSIEVEFCDKSFHRPIKFTEEVGYSMASVGKAGAVFASSALMVDGVSRQSHFHFVSLDSWTRVSPWTIELSDGEVIIGVAIGSSKYSVMATSAGYLRSVTCNQLQGPIVNYHGQFVSIVANANLLLLLTADELTSELFYSFYNLDEIKLLNHGSVGGRFRSMRITWAGINDQNIAGIFDESQTLHVCNPLAGFTWQPWYEGTEYMEKGHQIWPISFTTQELSFVIVKDGSGAPEVIPKPILSVIPLRIPFLNISDPSVSLYEQAYRSNLTLELEKKHPSDLSDRERKRIQLASDKHVLELIQLAIKADKQLRVLQLCEIFMMEKSWDLAVKLVRHNRLTQLADRIEALKEQFNQKNESIILLDSTNVKDMTTTTPKRSRTLFNKMSSAAVSEESPSTLLANLTPTVAPSHIVDRFVEDSVEHTSPLKRVSTPPVNSQNNDIPFKRLALESPKMESTSSGLFGMLKTIRDATDRVGINDSDPKKSKTTSINEPLFPSKPKKQMDLSLFTKKATAGATNQVTEENIDTFDNQ